MIQYMADNWIERKSRIEKVSRDGAPTVWLDVVGALEDCCKSFTANYPAPPALLVAEAQRQNGHRLRISVKRVTVISHGGGTATMPADIIELTFDASTPRITVSQSGNITHFPIGSDEEHAFLIYKEEPISIDDFSRIVLENVLFPQLPTAPRKQWTPQGKPSYTAWS
jgi:hypothetical protein